jgi:hypothetical protein
MKKQLLSMALTLVAVFASAAMSTTAQSKYGVRANVPFDFIVGDKTFLAGEMTANGVTASDVGALSIISHKGSQQESRIAHSMLGADACKQGKLVFHRYGNSYYLAEVWVPGYRGWEVIKSRSEQSLQREIQLSKNSKPELVTVVAEMQ